jgi:drug/metabolite transporter (DMT)-like permease
MTMQSKRFFIAHRILSMEAAIVKGRSAGRKDAGLPQQWSMNEQRTPIPDQPPVTGRPAENDAQGPAPSRGAARLLVLAAAVLWSTSGFFVKAPYFRGWPGPALAFWRAAFACLVLWPLVRRPAWSWKLLPAMATFVLMNYTFLTAMAKGSAANAIWLQCTAPVWVLLLGVFVFRERAVWRDWLLVAFAAIGVGVILYYEMRQAAMEAVLWGLASGFFYAGVVLSLRQLRAMESAWLVAMNHLATAIALAPLALNGLWSSTGAAPLPGGVQWLLLAGLGICQMGLPYVLFARGLRSIPGHEATGIGLIEPLLVPLWVYLAWGDKPAWWTLVGGGLILMGLAIRYLEPRRGTAEGRKLSQ